LHGKKKKLVMIWSNQHPGAGPIIHMFKKFCVVKELDDSSSWGGMPTNELDSEPVIHIIL
jgi:hypothetical protein